MEILLTQNTDPFRHRHGDRAAAYANSLLWGNLRLVS